MTVARHGILLRRLLAGAFLFIVIYYDLSTAAAKGRQQVFATLAIINHVPLFIVLHALHGFFNAHHNKVSSSLQLRFIFPFFFYSFLLHKHINYTAIHLYRSLLIIGAKFRKKPRLYAGAVLMLHGLRSLHKHKKALPRPIWR